MQNKLLWQTLISNVMKITSSLCLVSFKLSLIYFAADLYYLGVAWRRKHSLLTQLIILARIEQECGNLKHHRKMDRSPGCIELMNLKTVFFSSV